MNENREMLEVSTSIIVDNETAENEFDRWIRAMRIKFDRPYMDENDRKDNRESKGVILEMIQEGRVVVDDEGQLKFNTENEGWITFYRPKGNVIAEMDKVKKTSDVGKLYAAMGALTRTSKGMFSTKLWKSDVDICQEIFYLFL